MNKKILLFLMLLFLNINYVFADSGNDFTYANVKTINDSSNESVNNDIEKKSCDDVSNSRIINSPKISYTIPVTHYYPDVSMPFYVYLMVDNTGSMSTGNKVKYTNESIEIIVDKLRSASPVTKKTIIKFAKFDSSIVDISGGYSIDNVPEKYVKRYLKITASEGLSKLGGKTDIQQAYKNAYNYFKDTPTGYVPLFIFITDGYPTQSYSNVDITGKFNNVEDYWNGYVGAYRAARTLTSFVSTLKKINSDSRVVTIGVGLDSKDEYAKFILNPSAKNFNNLNGNDEDLYSTESKSLYNYISKKNSDKVVYTSMSLQYGHGVFRYATISKTGDKIYYRIPNNRLEEVKKVFEAGNENWYVNFVSNSGKVCHISFAKGSKHIEYKTNKTTGKSFIVLKNLSSLSSTCVGSNIITKNKKGEFVGVYANKATPIKNEDWFLKYPESEFASFVGGPDEVKSKIGGIIESIQAVSKKMPHSEEFKTDYTKNNYTNSIVNEITIDKGSLYYKFDATAANNVKFNDSKSLSGFSFYSGNRAVSCIPVSGKPFVKVLVTENSSLNLNPSDVSYAGSGFSLDSTLKNSLTWYYYSNLKDGKGGISINLVGDLVLKRIVSGDDDYYIGKPSSLANVNLNDFYTDSNCINRLSNTYSYDILNQDISNAISEKVNSVNGNNIFKSVDSNDSKNKENVNIKTTISGGLGNNKLNSVGISTDINYKFSLNKGCIAKKDYKYNDVVLTNGSVIYLDSPDARCGSDFKEGVKVVKNSDNKESLVNLYYIPVDYEKGEVFIKVNESDLSSFPGITIPYRLNCPVKVGKGALKYKYRAINTKNPFPKAKGNISNVPSNWQVWYDNSSNKMRLSNVYNTDPIYKLDVDKYDSLNNSLVSIIKYNNEKNHAYSMWNGMNNDGRSSFVNGKSGVNFNLSKLNSNSFCPLGEFNDSCDK